MPMTWRPADWADIEQGLKIQPEFLGAAQIGEKAAIEGWKYLFRNQFFASAVLESRPPIRGYKMIGLGASVFVSTPFADAEIANPRPDINSRVLAAIHSRRPVLVTREEVAHANAGEGVELLVVGGFWRDEILGPCERHEVQTLLASSFVEWHVGYRIRRILHETADPAAREFAQRSVVYQPIAEFPEFGRVIHLMTSESARAMPASLGNLLFSFREPVLRLRVSDQQLLGAALNGTTDLELTTGLELKLSAVKARWRSIFARVEEVMPGLVSDIDDHDGRGTQKRHRVLAYVRDHPEELRPYHWRAKTAQPFNNGD